MENPAFEWKPALLGIDIIYLFHKISRARVRFVVEVDATKYRYKKEGRLKCAYLRCMDSTREGESLSWRKTIIDAITDQQHVPPTTECAYQVPVCLNESREARTGHGDQC